MNLVRLIAVARPGSLACAFPELKLMKPGGFLESMLFPECARIICTREVGAIDFVEDVLASPYFSTNRNESTDHCGKSVWRERCEAKIMPTTPKE